MRCEDMYIFINESDRSSFKRTHEFWDILEVFYHQSSKNKYKSQVVLRDRAFFILCYSFGLRPMEAINIRIGDICPYVRENSAICFSVKYNGNNRIAYPSSELATKYIYEYIKEYQVIDCGVNDLLFKTSKNTSIKSSYFQSRLSLYNSNLQSDKRIDYLYDFRRLFIEDVFKSKSLTHANINSLLGTNCENNSIYASIFNTIIGGNYEF
jgi:site-specific recombinase XerD